MKQFNPDDWLEKQKEKFNKEKVEKLANASLESFQKADSEGCLFHGTHSRSVFAALECVHTRLHPKKVVFAGFPWVALAFTATWTDKDVSMGTIDNVPYLYINSKKVHDMFLKGGFIYQLSPEHFIHTQRLTRFEFISEVPIRPISSVFVKDPLSLMEDMGVDLRIDFK